jgi:hypothetical protein
MYRHLAIDRSHFSSEIYFMTPEEEFAIRSQLKWKRDGNDYVLLRGRRRMGRVTQDLEYPGK